MNLAIPYPVLPFPISVVKSFKAFLFLSLHFLQVLSPQVHYCTMAADSIVSLLPCLLDTKPLLLKARKQLGGFVSAFTAFNARIEVLLLYPARATTVTRSDLQHTRFTAYANFHQTTQSIARYFIIFVI
jgi:hypothetical protein